MGSEGDSKAGAPKVTPKQEEKKTEAKPEQKKKGDLEKVIEIDKNTDGNEEEVKELPKNLEPSIRNLWVKRIFDALKVEFDGNPAGLTANTLLLNKEASRIERGILMVFFHSPELWSYYGKKGEENYKQEAKHNQQFISVNIYAQD